MGNWIGDESDWWNRGGGGDPGTSHGYDARFVPRGGLGRDVYDTVIDYEGTIKGRKDQSDLLGPTLGETTDPLVRGPGESKPLWFTWLSDPGKLTGLIALVGALWLLGPVIELISAIAGD